MSNIKYVLSYMWNDKILRYLLLASLMVVIFMVIYVSSSTAETSKTTHYLPKGVKVLAFIGNPVTLDLTPVRLTSYEDQVVRFFHKKSGPGLHAYYLKGFQYKTDSGYEVIRGLGYFIVPKRKVKHTKHWPKSKY